MAENKENENNLKEKDNQEEEKQDQPSDQDLEFMISEVEKRLGIDRSQFKIVKYKQKHNFKNIIFDIFQSIIINIVLIMSITGFLKWAEYKSVFDVLIFALFFSFIEMGIKYLLLLIFRNKLLKAMLLIMTLPTLLAIILSLTLNTKLALTTLAVTSVELVLLMFATFIILRNVLKTFIIRKRRKIR
mgnify:CR=1 FL=1